MTLEALLEKTFNYGLPTTLLALVLYGLWKAVAWLGPNFLTPIKDQIVVHLAKLDASIDALMTLIRGQTDAIAKQNEVLDRVEHRIEHASVESDSNTEILKRIDENVSDLKRNANRFFVESHEDRERDLDHS